MARAGARPPRLASDAELVERARSGSDGDAFGELTRRHRGALVRVCARIVGPDLAEDAAQQALLKALVALRGDGPPPAEIRAWLLRVARNESIDTVRRHALEAGSVEAEPVTSRTPHDVLEERGSLRATVREIGRLPDRQRHALLLRAIEGHGYEQIAAALDASEGMVRQLIYRARERVRAAAAAVIAPLWLLRRGLPAAHAAKVSAVVATAGVAVGGAAVIHHGERVVVSAGPAEANAATPAQPRAKPAHEMQVVLAGPSKPRRRVNHPALAHPHAIAPKRRAAQSSPAPKPQPQPAAVHHNAAQPSPPPKPQPQPHPHSQPDPQPAPTPAPEPAHITPAPSPPPPPPPAPPAPSGPAAPAEAGHISAYSQGTGFGGPLTIERTNGEHATAYFGELVELSCYFVRDGHVVSHETCTKERLTPGTPIAVAEHGKNANGYDVWTRVELILPAP
jgi:RNA polymerase sigma-70 factor (ECF subfamily)